MESYICRLCGEEYSEEPEDNFCMVCHENEVYPASYSTRDWDEE
jgi:hypothetical protein